MKVKFSNLKYVRRMSSIGNFILTEAIRKGRLSYAVEIMMKQMEFLSTSPYCLVLN